LVAIRNFPGKRGAEKLHVYSTVKLYRRPEPEVKDRSRAKDGTLERFRCRTVEKEVRKILQMLFANVARRILLIFHA